MPLFTHNGMVHDLSYRSVNVHTVSDGFHADCCSCARFIDVISLYAEQISEQEKKDQTEYVFLVQKSTHEETTLARVVRNRGECSVMMLVGLVIV